MKRKGKLNVQRDAVRVEMPAGNQDMSLFFFLIIVDGDEIKAVVQTPDWPVGTTDDNYSTLLMHQWAIALHVTWMPFKPEPKTDLRYQGYLAIQDELVRRDPGLKKVLHDSPVGFGHIPSDKVELTFNPPKGDDA